MNIRYSPIFKLPRLITKHLLASIYPVIIKIFPLPEVKSIEETLDKIIKDRVSISRFGDGEFLYIIDKLNLPFQNYDTALAEKMITILKSTDENILIGLPIGYQSLKNLKRTSQLTWKSQISWIYPRLRKYLDLTKTYYNSSMTRVYAPFEDKADSKYFFELLMRLWDGRDILIVEGEKSRLGVGNNLFSKANSVERILAPMHHAYSKYHELYYEVLKHNKNKLILIALGPTATALSYDLAKAGFQAVDIGNVDIEYEWYLRSADTKIKIPGKYTSEATGGRKVEDIDDPTYLNQIISSII